MMSFDNQIKQNLPKICEVLFNPDKKDFVFSKFQDNSFLRNRKITLPILILCLMMQALNKKKHRIPVNNHNLWRQLGIDSFAPTDRAYRKVASKLSPKKIMKWACGLSDACPHTKDNEFYGHEVFLVDGSRVLVPRSKQTKKKYGFFGSKKGKKSGVHYPHINLISFTERGSGKVRAIKMEHSLKSERKILKESISDLPENSLLVGDSGFDGFPMAYTVNKLGRKYLIRLKESNYKIGLSKVKFVKKSGILTLNLNSETLKNNPDLEGAPKSIDVRVIKVRKGRTQTKTSKRKTKKSRRKSSNRPIYVMTNITDIPTEDLCSLYRERQEVESTFNFAKNYGGIEHIHHNTSIKNIELIIAAVIAYHNIVHSLVKNKTIDKKKKINVKALWDTIFFDLLDLINGVENMVERIILLIKQSLLQNKKGRNYPRINRRPISRHQLEKKVRLEEFKEQEAMKSLSS